MNSLKVQLTLILLTLINIPINFVVISFRYLMEIVSIPNKVFDASYLKMMELKFPDEYDKHVSKNK